LTRTAHHPPANAKRTVIDMIDQTGFTGVDAGTLAEGRRLQPGRR
jgi:predicted dinucleotide-binding enzyme